MLNSAIASANPLLTETEAAAALGLALDQFRILVRLHLSDGEETPPDTLYRRSDLVVLSILHQQAPAAAVAHV